MNTISLFVWSGGKLLRLFSVAVLLIVVVFSTAKLCADEADKRKIVCEVAQNWIEVGQKQYDRGFYEQSEKSFIKALDYQRYLTAVQQEKIKERLEKVHAVLAKRQVILAHIQKANELLSEQQLIKAKAHFENIKSSEFLTDEERKFAEVKLFEIRSGLDSQKNEIQQLYSKSVALYDAGKFEQARIGFVKIARSGLLKLPAGETAEEYLIKIDGHLVKEAKVETLAKEEQRFGTDDVKEVPTDTESVETKDFEVDTNEIINIADPITSEKKPIRKLTIAESYARAVVKDAVGKARNYTNEGRYYRAQKAVEQARHVIGENSGQLGEELFKKYDELLNDLSSKIISSRAKWLGQAEGD